MRHISDFTDFFKYINFFCNSIFVTLLTFVDTLQAGSIVFIVLSWSCKLVSSSMSDTLFFIYCQALPMYELGYNYAVILLITKFFFYFIYNKIVMLKTKDTQENIMSEYPNNIKGFFLWMRTNYQFYGYRFHIDEFFLLYNGFAFITINLYSFSLSLVSRWDLLTNFCKMKLICGFWINHC